MAVFVVSAPSGAGKTTLNRRLLKECPQLEMSISHTTRPPRPGEIDGVHYHFVKAPAFKEMVAQKRFIEWAEVHGNLYGTSFSELERIENAGKSAVLEIDVQGWHLIKPLLPRAISIFILPPSLESLWKRLESRGSDSIEIRWGRLQNAYDEIKKANEYEYLIVNDELEAAFAKVKNLILNGTCEPQEQVYGRRLCEKLNEEFETADWIKKLRVQLGS